MCDYMTLKRNVITTFTASKHGMIVELQNKHYLPLTAGNVCSVHACTQYC